MKSSKKTVGIIINPIAGIGGRVGMKGSDGARAQERALRLGAVPLAPARAEEAIAALLEIKDEINILAAPGCMGEDICQKLGLSVNTVGVKTSDKTSAQDTESVAQEMVAAGGNLLLFVGGRQEISIQQSECLFQLLEFLRGLRFILLFMQKHPRRPEGLRFCF